MHFYSGSTIVGEIPRATELDKATICQLVNEGLTLHFYNVVNLKTNFNITKKVCVDLICSRYMSLCVLAFQGKEFRSGHSGETAVEYLSLSEVYLLYSQARTARRWYCSYHYIY